MEKPRRARRYNHEQRIRPLEFKIPEGHLIINIKISQDDGPIDKRQALEILKTRPYVAGVIDTLRYRGTTSKYHVFSYPDPKSH